MVYFTSDWHLGEKRLGEFNPFFRPFKNAEEQDECIIHRLNSIVREDDILYHLGDVLMDEDSFRWLDKIKCKNRLLTLGNHDLDFKDKLEKYFDVCDSITLDINGENYHLNHYPIKEYPLYFNVVGHIHGLWKVKRNMVNVSVDAWHFFPVLEKEIIFVRNAIKKGYYDENVFYRETASNNITF